MNINILLNTIFLSLTSFFTLEMDYFLNEEMSREAIKTANISPARAKELLSKPLIEIKHSKRVDAFGLFYIKNKEYYFLHTFTKPPLIRGFTINFQSGKIKEIDMTLRYRAPYERNVMEELKKIQSIHD